MAHFAQIDENNLVIQVLVTDNNDPRGDEGYQWLIDNLGGTWIKTSYNANIRKNYAGIGFTYDYERDAFIAPKPFDSWVLDEATCRWEAPTPYPTDGFTYLWNEEELAWELADFSEPNGEIES
jgi:hypothetical protein